jgi:hypothetical protein
MGIRYLTKATDHFGRPKPKLSPGAAALMALFVGASGEGKPERPLKRCALPGCNNFTDHNGGYCSADHCRRHREGGKA